MNRTGNKLLWGLMAFLAVGVAIFLTGQYAPGDPDRFFPQQRLVYLDTSGRACPLVGANLIISGPARRAY